MVGLYTEFYHWGMETLALVVLYVKDKSCRRLVGTA